MPRLARQALAGVSYLAYGISLVLLSLVLGIAAQALTGHLFGLPLLYRWGSTDSGMAINTAIAFVLLALAGLCFLIAFSPIVFYRAAASSLEESEPDNGA